jgi:DNA-binding response OmpR family regulator
LQCQSACPKPEADKIYITNLELRTFKMAGEHILIVDDDDVAAALLDALLQKSGYRTTRYTDAVSLLPIIECVNPDAIILDGQLPSADGFELCRDARAQFQGPILILTARDEDVDELIALELGADDYLRKPTSGRMIIAHLRACLRRATRSVVPADAFDVPTLKFDNIEIDPASRTLTIDGQEQHTTTAEFDLLWRLASSPGKVVSREEIYRAIRGFEYDGLDRSIDMRISRLRKLLKDSDDSSQHIRTVRNRGYMFCAR